MKPYAFLLETEIPLYEELWYYFVDTYVNTEKTYENLDFGGILSPQLLIIGLFIGLAIASIFAVFNKQINGSFANKLLSDKCLSRDSAKTLPELDCADKLVIRHGVRRGVNIRRVVRCREEEEALDEAAKLALSYEEMRKENPKLPKKFTPKRFKVDPDIHHFYIPTELKEVAEIKFSQKGNSWWSAIIYTVIILVALVVLIVFLPNILTIIDAFVGILK